MDTFANATSYILPFSTPVTIAVASRFIDDASWSYPKIILGPILAAAIYIFVDFFFPGRPLTDRFGNRIPSGPRGLPIVGKVAES
jgi:hypothetical protein